LRFDFLECFLRVGGDREEEALEVDRENLRWRRDLDGERERSLELDDEYFR